MEGENLPIGGTAMVSTVCQMYFENETIKSIFVLIVIQFAITFLIYCYQCFIIMTRVQRF